LDPAWKREIRQEPRQRAQASVAGAEHEGAACREGDELADAGSGGDGEGRIVGRGQIARDIEERAARVVEGRVERCFTSEPGPMEIAATASALAGTASGMTIRPASTGEAMRAVWWLRASPQYT
jgi:hypothetical protein